MLLLKLILPFILGLIPGGAMDRFYDSSLDQF